MRSIPQERPTDPNESIRLMHDDTKFAQSKIAAFQYFAVAVFVFLITGFWDLQVLKEEIFKAKAQQNQIKSLPIPAPRGRILDRDGRVIVDNHSSYRLILSRENLQEAHITPIALGLNLDSEELGRKVRRFRNQPTFFTIPLKEDLTPDELTFVEAHRGDDAFPEMELIRSQHRLYPRGGAAAHLLGYTGEINDAELNTQEFAKHNPGDIIGKMGIERFYNDGLNGIDGQRQVRVDNRMNTREVLGIKEAQPGRDLRLTIDLDLQMVAELAMEGKSGAVVAIDPRNGEVLALVSTPAYDPNHFIGRINTREWKALNENPELPLLNRAIQAQLAPGSTFKPIMALAGLEEGVIDETTTVHCSGSVTYFGRPFKCHKKGGHGTVSLHRAIAQSCDVYFYMVGNRLGIDKIAKYAEMAGLGKETGVDLPHEKAGVVPSNAWKIRRYREKWYAGETISVSIGQGALTITPIQLAHAIGGIVTGGVWMRPHLVKEDKPSAPARRFDLNLENVNRVMSGMYAVVNEGGTGAASRIPGVEFSGKTGSAQRVSNELAKKKDSTADYRDDGWFVGFAPRSQPEIVVAALFEHGVHGDLAAPIVRDVVKAWHDKKLRTERPKVVPSLARAVSPLPATANPVQ